ncbi:MAG: hypothetical protein HYX68_15560 [Planctomycetes bacterium]|nr:hypothetical protein [Planctomycetota bacterium]
MVHGRRPRFGALVRQVAVLSGIVLALTLAPTSLAQRILNETLPSADRSAPINVSADHAATWDEAGRKVFLLKDAVISQGSTVFRSPEAVVWVDQARFEKEKVYHVVVFGDKSVRLERTKAEVQADYGYLRTATTEGVTLNVYKSQVLKRDLSSDRLYLRALANLSAMPEAKPASPALVQPIATTSNPGAGIQLTGGSQPAPLPSVPTPLIDPKKSLDLPPAPEPKKTFFFQVPGDPKAIPEPKFPGAGPMPPSPPPMFSPNPLPAPAPRKAQPRVSIRPRYAGNLQVQYKPMDDGMTAVIVTGTGGVIVLINGAARRTPDNPGNLDIEADHVVIWTKGNGQKLFSDMKSEHGADSGAHEIYMSGHVEIRTRTKNEVETLRAEEVYYDVRRGVAVARKADLEIMSGKLYRPLHMITDELIQVNPKLYKAVGVGLYSSIIPSDPGLIFNADDVTIDERQTERTYLGLFPAYDRDGKRVVDTERHFTGRNLVARIEGVPLFYFPYLRGNIEDPLGPFEGANISYDRILGFQLYTTWDIYDLLNLPKIEGTRWRLNADYLSARGPGLGTEFDFRGRDLFGTKAYFTGVMKLYGMMDNNPDLLGGNRGQETFWPSAMTPIPITHPTYRGWAYGKINVQDLPAGFNVLGQLSFLSDRNFLEQYYFNTHLNELNQNTYLYAKQQQDNWAWSLFGQISVREWVTETDWLPKADGYLTGQTFLDDWLVYNARASAGFGRLRPSSLAPFAYMPTDIRTDAGRVDLLQDISLPFYLGPVKVAPYVVGDLAYYSQDVSGDSRGRLYGGAGLRWNMPLSRLFPDIQSELFNLNGIYHKVNLTGNYFTAASSSRFTNFSQFDRLNDDATDQALRDITPRQSALNPTNASYLTSSPLFNPQSYLIRRLIDSNVDTLDQIDVLQLGIRQRWQTKRGFPGNEHVIDWMTFNLGVSIFPRSDRDNFGHTFGILEYDWTWNIGDRTALTSSGWFEPFDGGPRVFDFGAVLQRPDTTQFYIGYRQIDPVRSKAVVANVTYPFSSKYALTANTIWDFGVNVQTYGVYLTRMGTDVMVNFGINYNSTVNTFGVAFEVLPNLSRRTGRTAGLFPMPLTNIDPMINQR